MKLSLRLALLLIATLWSMQLRAQDSAPRVLVVIAHPDDEQAFAATIYKITHDLKGTVDLALVTNGEGGYKYSTLAEAYYGLELTDEKVGREHLPTIRKRELMAAGRIIGLRNYFFLDQIDHRYTLNVDSVLRYVWDIGFIQTRLKAIIEKGDYDYIFSLLPTPDTHGHHKGATILALRAVAEVSPDKRPVVLGGSTSTKGDTTLLSFTGLDGYPETRVGSGVPSFAFDRTQKFGFRDALDYKIIVNWEIAEHKSQGTVQMLFNRGDYENFWFFDSNDRSKLEPTRQLFERLKVVPYVKKEYK